jgi:hypothetical protein
MPLRQMYKRQKRKIQMVHSNNYVKKDLPKGMIMLGWILLVVGVILGLAAFLIDYQRAVSNYLLAYMFILSIGIGSLFLIALEYVAGADWSTPLRRVIEFFSSLIPFLFILVIPLLFSAHDLFHWTHEEAVAEDAILQGKAPYLNMTFFIIRVLVILVVWTVFWFMLIRNSERQDDTGEPVLTKRNITLSAIFIPVFALTVTVSAVDWIMSLEPHWFSTIFGVYFFSGAVVASLAAVTLGVVTLKERGYMHPRIINDHYYSLGALMFAFINFWGYIAFSQYMLIWYADLPEENFWFLQRWQGGWEYISVLLIIVHFVVPYAALLSQPSKMDPKRLKFVSFWILIAHAVDLYWLILPNMYKEGFSLSWIDFVFPVFMAGFIIVIFNLRAGKKNLIPIGDPKLERGLNFHL